MTDVTEAERPWVPERPYTYDDISPNLAQIVKSKPAGYKYEKWINFHGDAVCAYWHADAPDGEEGVPGCLIGQLLYLLKVPREMLIACNGCDGGSLSSVVHSGVLGPMFTPDTAWVLRMIQIKQDDGFTWAECLEIGTALWKGVVYARKNPE